METLGESVDGKEDTVHDGRNPSDLLGKSEICTAVEEKPGVGELGFGVEVASGDDGFHTGSEGCDRYRRPNVVLKDEALKFGDYVMKRYGFLELKLSIISQNLMSDSSSSRAPPRNAACCGTREVPVAEAVSEVFLNVSEDKMVVRFVRKAPLADTSKVATVDTEALGDFEGNGRALLGKRKENVDITCDAVGEPKKRADLGFSIENEDTEAADESFSEKLNLDALEKAEQPYIAAVKVSKFSDVRENDSGNYGAAAVDQTPLSDTSGKEEVASTPVTVTPNARKQKSLRHTINVAEPPITRSRTRGAKRRARNQRCG